MTNLRKPSDEQPTTAVDPIAKLVATTDPDELYQGRIVASRFVLDQAELTAEKVGFNWRPTPDEPTKFEDLQAAYALAMETGTPLPVSDKHSESVMFTDPSVNFALRFWHDVHHVQLGLSFDLVHELELALYLLGVAQEAGIREHSVAWRLLQADFVGQVYLQGVSKRYPDDQLRFATGCVLRGLDRGVLDEARLTAEPDKQ